MKVTLSPLSRHYETVVSTVELLCDLYPMVEIRRVEEVKDQNSAALGRAGRYRKSIQMNLFRCEYLTTSQVRWVVTHEFGHHLLHCARTNGFEVDLVPDEHVQAIQQSIPGGPLYSCDHRPRPDELFAEAFAATILLPEPVAPALSLIDCALGYVEEEL